MVIHQPSIPVDTTQDKLSQLPDDILLKFLALLDLKNAVRTSILAKRWRYLWTWRTDLVLNPEKLSPDYHRWSIPEIGVQKYLNWVNQVVDAHSGPCISKFRVCYNSMWSNDTSQIDKWARFAFSKRVEDLDLGIQFYRGTWRFSLGFDILKHPRNNGIINLKSLRLSSVDVTGEALEYILSQCHLLERLHVESSQTMYTLNVVSYKLKHLAVNACNYLKELRIHAVNLISFQYEQYVDGARAHIELRSAPKLDEVCFAGVVCTYQLPIWEQISYLSKHLTKLNFSPTLNIHETTQHAHTPVKFDVVFPNVKQLTFTDDVFFNLELIEVFINACPMLHKLKLQVYLCYSKLMEEAEQLRDIELENEQNAEMSKDQSSFSEEQKENVVNYVECEEYKNNQSHPNLKVLEIVGFHGCYADVKSALHIIAFANSFETLIWDPRCHLDIGTSREYSYIEKIDTIKRRARKLSKLLPPKVHVGVRDKSDLLWVS